MLPLSFLYFLLIPLGIYDWLRRRRQLPDGPLGIPVFGNFFDLKGQVFHKKLCEWNNEYGDVFSYMIGQRPVVVLNTLESLDELCVKKGHIYSSRPRTSKQADICTRDARIVNMEYGDKWRVGQTKAPPQELNSHAPICTETSQGNPQPARNAVFQDLFTLSRIRE